MLTNEDLAYIAGIVDGEGYIGLMKYKTICSAHTHYSTPKSLRNPNPKYYKRIVFRVSVGMADRQIPEWLHKEFGGNLQIHTPKNPLWKDKYVWAADSQVALRFVKLILPFLRVKKTQAEIAMRFQKARVPHIRLSSVQKQADTILYEAMSKLNKRGKEVLIEALPSEKS